MVPSQLTKKSFHLGFSCSTWESRGWEWMNCHVGGSESEWDVAFPGWHLMPWGSLIFFPLSLSFPWGNNAPLIIICSLSAWQVLSWDFSANKTVQTFVVPSTTFSNPGLTEVITTVLFKGFPFFPPLPHSLPHLLLVLYRDIMSIYKEPPPGMFVVPDTVDMTKVCNLLGVGIYWEIGPIKLEESKRLSSSHLWLHTEGIKPPRE